MAKNNKRPVGSKDNSKSIKIQGSSKLGKDIRNSPNSKTSNSDQNPVWSFSLFDEYHEKWGIFNQKEKEIYLKVIKKLRAYEGQTWGEIQSDTTGTSNNSKSHYINIEKLCDVNKKAGERLKELNLFDMTEQIFSLRIDGKTRLFGFITFNVFSVIWIDSNHEVFPSKKKHT